MSIFLPFDCFFWEKKYTLPPLLRSRRNLPVYAKAKTTSYNAKNDPD